MRENELCKDKNSMEWIEEAVEKLDGNQIVQVVCITVITMVIGAALVCMNGGEMSIGDGKIKFVA